MKFLKTLSLVISMASLSLLRVNAEEPPARFDFIRLLAMGGAFTAVADDHNIFNFNPAGMVLRTGGQLTILEIAAGASEDTKDAIDFISDNESDLTNWANLSLARQIELINDISNTFSKLNPRVFVAADVASYVSGPRFLGMPLHVGFGGFGTVDSSFRLDTGILVPTVSYTINNDIVLPLSLAKRWEAPWFIPGKIGYGVTGKLIRRFQVSRERQSILELTDLEAPPIADGSGVGMDVGILHQVTDRVNWGLMVRDFLGTNMSFDSVSAEDGFQSLPSRDTVIRPRTNVGIALVPQKLLWLVPTTDRWTFAADVRDVFNKDKHLFFENGFKKPFGEDLYTNLHLGAEYRWFIFRFRGGFNQGYPTFGSGIDIPLLKLDYAFFSRELGAKAGDLRQGHHAISVALRFGSGKVEANERIKKSKQERKGRKQADPTAVPEMEPADVPEPEIKEESLVPDAIPADAVPADGPSQPAKPSSTGEDEIPE